MSSAKPAPRSRRSRRVLQVLVVSIVLLLVADQLVHRLVLGDGWLVGQRIAPFDPPLFSTAQVEAVGRLERELVEGPPAGQPVCFDSDLGWGHVTNGGSGEDRIDGLGARIHGEPHGRVPRDGLRRILAFGCSFTYGTEVAACEVWPAQLDALRDDTEVINLAVAGFGVDQAFLRWRRDGQDLGADEVWLGFFPTAAPRTVNVYRPALRHWSVTVAFKPRFELDASGALRLVPQPARDLADLIRLVQDSEAFVAAVGDHDSFVRRVRSAYLPRGAHWSHHTAVGRMWWTFLDRLGRDPRALLSDPDSEVHRVTEAIGVTMDREVEARGARFRLLILPGREDLVACTPDGGSSWSTLAATWRAAGLDIVDLAPPLLEASALTDDSLWMPGGHYSPAAHALVARALADLP